MYRLIQKPPSRREVTVAENDMDGFKVAVLGRQVEGGHPVGASELNVGSHVEQVLDHLSLALGTGYHQGRPLFLVQSIHFSADLR